MTRTGVTHTDTASGKGHGQLTENPGAPARKKPRKSDDREMPTGQMQGQDAPPAGKSPKAPGSRR